MWKKSATVEFKTDFRPPTAFDDTRQLQALMLESVEHNVSDVFFQVGNPVLAKINGSMHQMTHERLTVGEVEQILGWACGSAVQAAGIQQGKEVRTSYSVQHPTREDAFRSRLRYRFRVNAVRGEFRNAVSAQIVMRSIASEPATVEEVGLEPELIEAMAPKDGCCWMTGATGSGKSKTIGAQIRHVCEGDTAIKGNILTLESPIEAVYDNVASSHSVVHQVEVYRDIPSFHDGLVAFMRMNPSLIVVGETRDEPTSSAALEAAETGHTVLSTLHANNCASIPSRLLSFYPPEHRESMLFQVIDTARVFCNQRLVLNKEGNGRLALREFLVLDADMRDHIIRTADPIRLTSVLRDFVRTKGRTFRESAERAYENGLISGATVDEYRSANG